MRPKIKDDAQRVSLTLSGPKRKILMKLAMARGVSRTQIIEDLLEEKDRANNMLGEGNVVPLPHLVGDASNILKPSAGGFDAPTRYATAAETKRQARSSK
jgi:hypothetical protein